MNDRHLGRIAGFQLNLTFVASLIALGLSLGVSRAAVIVSLTDNDVPVNETVATVGTQFTITVTLTSTLEQTTGISYFLLDPSASAGNAHFQITDRDTTGSTYSFLTEPNNAVVTNPTSAVLDPSNNTDLGGGVANLNSPNGVGSFFVANISLLVLPTTPPGNYSIGLTPNSVAAGPGPNFDEIQVQSVAITVVAAPVPEPGAVSLLALGGLFFAARRRFWQS